MLPTRRARRAPPPAEISDVLGTALAFGSDIRILAGAYAASHLSEDPRRARARAGNEPPFLFLDTYRVVIACSEAAQSLAVLS